MHRKATLISFFLLSLTACSLAPKLDVKPPALPAAFKEEKAEDLGQWTAAQPLDKQQRGQWWLVFNDKTLNELEALAAQENQTLKIAAARVIEAQAAARTARAAYMPQVDVGLNAIRTQPSNTSLLGTSPYTVYQATGIASWEPDLFSRLRDARHALSLTADAQQAAYYDVLLTLQADIAQNYYSIRALDTERMLLRDTVQVYEKSSHIMQQRFEVGEVGEQDYARARSELESVRAQLTDLDRKRQGFEHGLAVLLGRLPSEYSFPEHPLTETPPRIPAGIPSTLLMRRPDVSSAYSLMAAANAEIGAARAAFLPDLLLTATGGFENASFSNLFQWSSHTWALGQVGRLALSLPIFDAGRRSAALDAARARYDGALAAYRQQILTAFRDVEDNLAGQRLLLQQSQQQDEASFAAGRVTELARQRYEAGDADYAEVVESERISLATARASVQTKTNRFLTTVGLMRALGGDWQ